MAVKVEVNKNKKSVKNANQFLKVEYEMYLLLNKTLNNPFPKVHQFISESEYNLMEM